jgi:hypothetical protein
LVLLLCVEMEGEEGGEGRRHEEGKKVEERGELLLCA